MTIFVVLGLSPPLLSANHNEVTSERNRGSSVLDPTKISKELLSLSVKSPSSQEATGRTGVSMHRSSQSSKSKRSTPDILFTVEDVQPSDVYTGKEGLMGTSVAERRSSSNSESCPYWMTLPYSDSICVAATELSNSMSFDIVKFHLLRYSDGSNKRRNNWVRPKQLGFLVFLCRCDHGELSKLN